MISNDNMLFTNKEDIILIESVLSSFIPFYNDLINAKMETREEIIDSLNNLLGIVDGLNVSKKKKKNFYKSNLSIKKEEKEFLYKMYFSSSDTNQNNVKLITDYTLKISVLSNQVIRSIIILLREEICNNDKLIMVDKLKQVKRIVISETKSFSFKNLFIILEYIILHFCKNVNEIVIDKISSLRLEQIDSMLKKGIILHYIYKAELLTKVSTINKIEFVNENVVFNLLYDYINKNDIKDISPEQIEINKINIIDTLLYKKSLEKIALKKVTIDKIKMIEQIITILKNNPTIKQVTFDKFISIPSNYFLSFFKELENLSLKNLQKVKIFIASSSINDLNLLNLLVNQNHNSPIKKFILKVQRISIEENFLNNYLKQINNNTKLEKFSIIAEKINLNRTNSILFTLIPKTLKYLTLGLVDHQILFEINKSIINASFTQKLDLLKLYFVPINDEHYDESYKDIVSIIENGRMIKKMHFINYILKYRSIIDEEIKKALTNNNVLRALTIQSEKFYKKQNINGLYYYELPLYVIFPLLYVMKKDKRLFPLYSKKRILQNITYFFRIKKEKVISLSYK